MRLERGHPPVRCPGAPSRPAGWPRGGRPAAASRPRTAGPAASASSGGRRPDAAARPRARRTTARAAARSGRPEQDLLLAVAHEAGLHEQLDVAVGVGAGDVEAGRAALGALAQELLDEPVADVAGVGHPDRVELDDRPLVADGSRAPRGRGRRSGRPPRRRTCRSFGRKAPERQPEQAEHADRRAVDRQPERARVGAVGLAQPGQLAERGEVGQPRGPDLADRCASSRARSSRRPVAPGLRAHAGSDGGAGRSPRPGRRARRPSSRRAGGSASRRRARGGTPWR